MRARVGRGRWMQRGRHDINTWEGKDLVESDINLYIYLHHIGRCPEPDILDYVLRIVRALM